MDATLALPVLVFLIAVALLFDFLNGLHDAANSIATIVSTRVLRPQYAVIWAAFFNFIAFLVFGLHVANTIGTGIIEPSVVDATVIFAALVGAIVWNLITWALGIPSSSSHALIGGLVGAGMAKAGISAAVWTGLSKTLLAIVLSPLVGFLLALVLVAIVSWLSVRSTPFAVDRAFRILQFVSASLYSLGHGGNDAQKTMGIIAVLLYSQGHHRQRLHYPVLGGAGVPGRDGARHADGRLADRPHHGTADHQADADAGILRGNRRGGDPVHGDLSRGSRLHDPHHYRRHRRRRRGAAGLGGALERGEFDRLCLGDHHSGFRDRGGADLLGGGAAAIDRVAARRLEFGRINPYIE